MKLLFLLFTMINIYSSTTLADILPRDSEIFVFSEKGTLKGVVYYEDIGFVPSSEELRPVSDVTVSIIDERSGVTLFQAVTEPTGHYFFKVPTAMLNDLSKLKLRVTNSEGQIIGTLHDLDNEINTKMGDFHTDLKPIFVRDQDFINSLDLDSTIEK